MKLKCDLPGTFASRTERKAHLFLLIIQQSEHHCERSRENHVGIFSNQLILFHKAMYYIFQRVPFRNISFPPPKGFSRSQPQEQRGPGQTLMRTPGQLPQSPSGCVKGLIKLKMSK